jgi:CubicO group peptidase (beta-lactamase class C family)
MKDTTFWPSGDQLKRLAKAYRPGKDKMGLTETTITALRYPLDDHKQRYPCPGGGLFSTAEDIAQFCQMLLNGGEFGPRRFLSEDAIKQLSSKQTGESLKDNYGLGFALGGSTFGHGGAYATNMNIDTKRGLITVWMVQHAGFSGDGGKAQGAFRKAAEEEFGKK